MKNGWFVKDCDNETILVSGSSIHWLAPVATHIETAISTTKKI